MRSDFPQFDGITRQREPLPGTSNLHPARSAEPLPAGSPVTWGAITAGTSLEGQPYPARPDSRGAGGLA